MQIVNQTGAVIATCLLHGPVLLASIDRGRVVWGAAPASAMVNFAYGYAAEARRGELPTAVTPRRRPVTSITGAKLKYALADLARCRTRP